MKDRYERKPLVRLLECYALDAIEELSNEDRANLEAMQPQLSKIFGSSGSWQEILETAMRLSPETRMTIKDMWEKNRKIADQTRQVLTPQNFAEIFVDQNFVGV